MEFWPDFFTGTAAWCGARVGGYGVLVAMTAVALLWPGYGGTGRLAATFTALVLAGLFPYDARIAGFGGVRGLAWVGGFSYPIYLIHVSLISPFKNLDARWVSPGSPAFAELWIAAVGLAIAGASLLHRIVEAPVELWRKRQNSGAPPRASLG
jgi:peptidoglycan/LPS O-acetylase OafA/YrhL